MLTLKYLLKSVRLQHAYGESRPGYINHDRASIEGPASGGRALARLGKKRSAKKAAPGPKDATSAEGLEKISIYIGSNSENGEKRLMIE